MELALVILVVVVAFIFRGVIKVKVNSLERKVMVTVTEDDIEIAKDAIRLHEEISKLPEGERDIFKVHELITKATKSTTSQS